MDTASSSQTTTRLLASGWVLTGDNLSLSPTRTASIRSLLKGAHTPDDWFILTQHELPITIDAALAKGTAMPIEHVDTSSATLATTATAIVPASTPSAAAQDFAAKSRSANTWRAYSADWADFTSWCDAHNRAPFPADALTVGDYLVSGCAVVARLCARFAR